MEQHRALRPVHSRSEVRPTTQVTLEERFAQIDIDVVRRELAAAATSPERIPPAIRQLICVPAFLATLSALFRKAA